MPYSDKQWLVLSRCAPNTGEEFDWYALDREGHLAIFTTAGLGPVPAAIWAHREKFYALETAVKGLPDTDTFEKVFCGPGNHSEWCDLARKGLFAFDYHDIHRTNRLHLYDLMARPANPVPASVLLPEVDIRWLPVLKVEFAVCTQLPDGDIGRAEAVASPEGESGGQRR